MDDFSNPLNSFAVISFNENDLESSVRYEYFNISGENSRVLSSNMRLAASPVLEAVTNEVDEQSEVHHAFEYSYWVFNDSVDFSISAMPADFSPVGIPNIFSGPFMSQFLAEKFIEELKEYLHNSNGI